MPAHSIYLFFISKCQSQQFLLLTIVNRKVQWQRNHLTCTVFLLVNSQFNEFQQQDTQYSPYNHDNENQYKFNNNRVVDS